MLVWDDLDPDEKVKVYDRGIDLSPEKKESYYETIVKYRIGDCWIPQLERQEALALEVDHLLDCIEGSASPITDGGAGRQVVRMLEAASASLNEHGRPIVLSEYVA